MPLKIIIIAVILYIALTISARFQENLMLSGFYKADTEFCQHAGLELLFISIGKNDLFSNQYSGYILAKNSDGLIMNNPVIFNLSGFSFTPYCSDREYHCEIDWIDEEGYDFFPSKLRIYYYPNMGKLIFMNKKNNVFAIVYKDNALCDNENIMPGLDNVKKCEEPLDNEYNYDTYGVEDIV